MRDQQPSHLRLTHHLVHLFELPTFAKRDVPPTRSTLHLWWARRPLAAARAVIFAQRVDNPSEYVAVLLGDYRRRRKAESELKARRKVGEEARQLFEKAEVAGIAAPSCGPEPTLESIVADLERQRLFRLI